MNRIKNIYIIDWLLVDFKGHCFVEATALRDAAEKLGLDARIIANAKADKTTARENNIILQSSDFSLHPPLWIKFLWKCIEVLKGKKEVTDEKNKNGKTSAPVGKINLSWKQNLKLMINKTLLRKLFKSYWIEKTFDDFFRDLPDEPESIYLFQTSSFYMMSNILRGLSRNQLDLRVVFSSHCKLPETEINEILMILENLKLTVEPAFFWSSEIYVKKYIDMGLPAGLLPIPQPGWSKYLNFPTEKNKFLTLSFIGLSAYNKGFHLLPELVKKVRQHFPQQKFQFDIQYSPVPKFDKYYELTASTYSILQNMDVNLISESLDNEAYYGLLSRSDIILQPYQTDSSMPHYASGDTSGILIEAMARGKIPIVPADTWLSMQVETFNSGKIFSGNDDFFSKTIEAVNEFDKLKSVAEANKEYWSRRHCPEQVIKTIIN